MPEEKFDIRIARDGTWYHEGEPIRRPELVRLFAGVLRRDAAGDYWLVTPVERGRIVVEDAPFVAVEMACEGEGRDQKLSFRTNIDQWVTAGPDNPLRFDPPADDRAAEHNGNSGPVPYIDLANGLSARIARPVYYELVERSLATAGADVGKDCDGDAGEDSVGLWSSGQFFAIYRAEDRR